jgi:hypothetical protein
LKFEPTVDGSRDDHAADIAANGTPAELAPGGLDAELVGDGGLDEPCVLAALLEPGRKFAAVTAVDFGVDLDGSDVRIDSGFEQKAAISVVGPIGWTARIVTWMVRIKALHTSWWIRSRCFYGMNGTGGIAEAGEDLGVDEERKVSQGTREFKYFLV